MVRFVESTILLLLLTFILSVYGGTITRDNDETVTLTKGKDKSFSWTFAPAADENIVGVFLYNGTENDENKLWKAVGDEVLPKGEEMFNGRLKVKYDDGKKLTVIIENAKLNDSITILLTGGFLKKDFTSTNKFSSSVTLDVQGGPEFYEDLYSIYNFSYNAIPSIKLGVAGKPKPLVEFTFDGVTRQAVGTSLTNEFHQFEFVLELPELKGRHCGKMLSYTATTSTTSTLQNSIPVTGNATIYVDDFPLDVTVGSFSYDEKIPTVKWTPVESGKCTVKYDIEISNETKTITRESVEGKMLQIPEMTEPTSVRITAIHGSRRGSTSDSFTFTKTTTTTTTTTENPSTSGVGNNDAGDDSNMGLIIGAAVGGVIVLLIIIIIAVCCYKKKKKKHSDSTDHSTNVNVNLNTIGGVGGNDIGGSEMSLQTWQHKRENIYTPVTRANAGPSSGARGTGQREDPNQAIYSELGPGGRVGPKPTPQQSNYAEVKVDENGFPITGASHSQDSTLYAEVKRESSDDDLDGGVHARSEICLPGFPCLKFLFHSLPESSTTPTSKPGDDSGGESSSNVGAIVGAVIGVLVLVAIVVAVIFYFKCRKTSDRPQGNNYGSNEDFEFKKNEPSEYAKPESIMKKPPTDEPDYAPVDKKYDELGPGGGRTGPKGPIVRSEYAQAKDIDEFSENEELVSSDGVIV